MSAETKFETETCTRCGGSGQYSWCQQYGSMCFRCAGSGRTYTARGRQARAHFEKLLSVPARDIRAGMRVRELVITEGGLVGGTRWVTVTEVQDNAVARTSGRVVNGETVYAGLNLVTTGCTFCAVNPESMYRVAADAATKQSALERALAYQDTLTKRGAPRKK